jgi:hypothetical protein
MSAREAKGVSGWRNQENSLAAFLSTVLGSHSGSVW